MKFKFIVLASFIFHVLSFAICTSAEAKELVLLTSIEDGTLGWRSNDITEKLENDFHEKFKDTSYQLTFLRNATMDDLLRQLSRPGVVGLFWISHGAAEYSTSGFGTEPRLIDKFGFNAFEAINRIDAKAFISQGLMKNPDLSFVSLISCYSELAAQKLRAILPHVQVMGFPKAVLPIAGLSKSIEASLPFLKASEERSSKSEPSYMDGFALFGQFSMALKIKRSLPPAMMNSFMPAVAVISDQKLIATYPARQASIGSLTEPFEEEILIPLNQVSGLAELNLTSNIIVISGESTRLTLDDVHLGNFEFSVIDSQGNEIQSWKPLQIDGQNIGRTKNIYKSTGSPNYP